VSINIADMGNSPYIASADFQIGTALPRLEIERIDMQDVPTPGKKDKTAKPAVWFKGAKKGYVLTKNVARAIAAKLGITTKDIGREWPGIQIQLEVVGDVRRPDGTRGNAFRLHDAWPKAAPTKPANEPVKDQTNAQ
jgi:hypothetical protein